MAWNFVSGIAKAGCEVFVITESEHAFGVSEKLKVKSEKCFAQDICVSEKKLNPRSLQGEGATNEWIERLHFYFVPIGDSEEESERIRRMCWNQGDWRFYHYYARWQEKVVEVARAVLASEKLKVKSEKLKDDSDEFILHQLNMAGFREPGMLYKINEERMAEGKSPLPLIWGPTTGFGSIPLSFLKYQGVRLASFYLLKNFLNIIQLKWHPRVRKMLKASDVVLACTPDMSKGIKRFHGMEVEVMNETGVMDAIGVSEKGKVKSERCYCGSEKGIDGRETTGFRLLWVGRFVNTKQLTLALRTMVRLKDLRDVEMHVVGRGFDDSITEEMHRYAEEIGVADRVVWHGQIPNEEVQQLMRECDVFFFTSFFEATSTVVLEAITNNLPVVCFNRCGFGPIVDESIGRKIECHSPKQAEKEFAEKITYLYNHRDVLEQMARNCDNKKRELSWETKIDRLMDIYREVCLHYAGTNNENQNF